MVYVEDDDYDVRTPYTSSYNYQKYFVPRNPYKYDPEDPQPVEQPKLIEENGCTAEPLPPSRCAPIRNAKQCFLTVGCMWDIEFGECFPVPTVLQYLQYVVFLLPVVYAVCYYGYSKAKVDAMWKPYQMFHGVYVGSVIFATLAFIYVGFRILKSTAYDDVRERYVQPTYMLLFGAAITPIAIALWADRNYSIYWVLIGLLITSIATIWFVVVHLRTASPQRRKDRVTVAAIYYGLFHVIIMDNFIWWWLLFSTTDHH